MLGARIALLRRQAGLSQRELAAALHISPSTVGMYEQDRRVPPAELLVKMARLFRISTDFLLTGNSRPSDAPGLRALLRSVRKMLQKSDGTAMEEADAALILAAVLDGGELTGAEKSAIIKPRGGGGMTDEAYMRQALALAAESAADGEVPVGCVIVDGDTIVGCGRNRRETSKNALAHAELEAIDEACRTLGGWRLWRCTLYVTLEPCPMCAGAIVNARLARVVYGAADKKFGACGGVTDLFNLRDSYRPRCEGGLLEAEAQALLQDFFRRLRETPKVDVWKRPTSPSPQKFVDLSKNSSGKL